MARLTVRIVIMWRSNQETVSEVCVVPRKNNVRVGVPGGNGSTAQTQWMTCERGVSPRKT